VTAILWPFLIAAGLALAAASGVVLGVVGVRWVVER